MASKPLSSGSPKRSPVPGERIVLAGDRTGRIRSFVAALARFPAEPRWSVVGGFAVNVRISHIHRLTNDLDTVSRDQTALIEILVAEHDASRLDAATLEITEGGTSVVIDVMESAEGTPLPSETSERAFALARRMALATSEWTELHVVQDGEAQVQASAPIASVPALIALKAVAIPRRSRGSSPEKVGSDIHDIVRLVQGCDFDAVAESISVTSDELCGWVGNTMVRWFSPERDLRYTFARLRRLTRSPDADALTEDDLTIVSDLGRMILGSGKRLT